MAVSVLFGVIYGILMQNPSHSDTALPKEKSKQIAVDYKVVEKKEITEKHGRDAEAVEVFLSEKQPEPEVASSGWLAKLGNQFNDSLTTLFSSVTSVLD